MSKHLIDSWYKRLLKAKVPEPRLSIKYFIEEVLLINIPDDNIQKFASDLIIKDDHIEKLEKMIFRREHHEPIQYIIGFWPFRNLQLKLRSPIFIPRPETEKLIDIVKHYVGENNKKIALEIGVGSGPISLSLLKETYFDIYGIDKSKEAVELTFENLYLNKLEHRNFNFSQINLTKYKEENISNISNFLKNNKIDVLISNPPYVPEQNLLKLQRQIQWYESIDALNGGKQGLDVIKTILDLARHIMCNKGLIFLEIDESHTQLFENFIKQNPDLNLFVIDMCNDIYERQRFAVLKHEIL